MKAVIAAPAHAFAHAALLEQAGRAPGVSNEVEELGGAQWHAFALTIDPSAADELAAFFTECFSDTPVEWAAGPGVGDKKRLLMSDMDSTIIGQECLDELADYAGLKAEISAITERAMRGELDFEGAIIERVSMLKGLDVGALEQCYRDRIRLNPGARTLVRTMAADGARCVLVSGGFTYFTERVAAEAGFHDHRANILLEHEGKLTGDIARPILGREAKLAALVADAESLSADLKSTLAIGDGANDLAMINAAGLGLAYRAKPVVAAEADAAIAGADLTPALFFQGYREDAFVLD